MLTLQTVLTLDDEIHLAPNIADRLSEHDRSAVATLVVEGFEADKSSRAVWDERMAAGLDLALQVTEEKSFPWPGAANVAFPLVTIAALQFHARAYPSLLPGAELVRMRTPFGATPELSATASAAAKYMSYQLLEEDPCWEADQDRALLNYAIVGCVFKKTYYDPYVGRNVSETVLAQDFYVDYYAKSCDTARRKTHLIQLSRNDIISGIRSDFPLYLDVSERGWFRSGGAPLPSEPPARDGTTPPTASRTLSAPFICLEQHLYLDLDADGYEEPYIATVEYSSGELLRLAPRWSRAEDIVRNRSSQIVSIRADEFFTKYSFIPSPDGSFYDLGFGILLGPINESVSTAINQLLDSGTMAVSAGGFLGKGAKVRGGDYSFSPFEWKRVDSTGEDLAKSIYPLPVREPSAVLFNLLSLLIDFTARISGATEAVVGENVGQNTPAETSRNMLQQGMKVYSAIFKRTWRGMKEEFKKLYLLNARFAKPPYDRLFRDNPDLVCPAADPNIASDAEALQRAITIAERARMVPGYDPAAAEINLLRALKVDDPSSFYVGVDPSQQQPDIRIQVAQIKAQTDMQRLQFEQQKFVAELLEERKLNQIEMFRLASQAQLYQAQAAGEADNLEIVKIQTALAAAKQKDDALNSRLDSLLKAMQIDKDATNPSATRAVQRLALPPDNAAVPPSNPPADSAVPGFMG